MIGKKLNLSYENIKKALKSEFRLPTTSTKPSP